MSNLLNKQYGVVNGKEYKYLLFEAFNSQEGEFPKVGYYSTFIRFPVCNNACWFCDTMRNPDNQPTWINYSEIKELVSKTHALTFTGGEPALFVGDMIKIISQLLNDKIYLDFIKIETSGNGLEKVRLLLNYFPELKSRFIISWSPKIYSDSLFQLMLTHLYETEISNTYVKIVAVPEDEEKISEFLTVAKELHGAMFMQRIALMPLSIVDNGVSTMKSDKASLEIITKFVDQYKVNVTPRLHEILNVR